MHTYLLDLYCPNIHFRVDEMMIQASLAKSPGLSTLSVDWERRRVIVATANQDGGLDIMDRLCHAGFPVERATAEEF